jgi:hypothetical protein
MGVSFAKTSLCQVWYALLEVSDLLRALSFAGIVLAFVLSLPKLVGSHTEHAQASQNRHAERERRTVTFQEGDLVLLSTRNAGRSPVQCRKFLPKFFGALSKDSVSQNLGQ